MNSSWSSLAAETSPGLALVVATVLAGLASYTLLSKPGRGRARSAIAYLSGLTVGLVATLSLAALLRSHVDPASLIGPGLLGAFFGPFAGMLRAKWERPVRRRKPPGWMGNAS